MFGGGRSYAAKAGLGVSDDSSIDEPSAEYLRREITVVVDIKSEEKELKASYEWSGNVWGHGLFSLGIKFPI